MTPNKKLQDLVVKTGVSWCVVPKHNAAKTNNKGLKLVKTTKVIITDADTVFGERAVDLLDKALNKYDVVKPKLVFRSGVTSPYFSPVANLRTFFNDNDRKVYIPGLSFNLSVKDKIGGYFFDEKIPWGEDSDFSDRVEKNRLKTKVVDGAKLYHPSVSFFHDLSDALLIGLKKRDRKVITKTISKRVSLFIALARSYGVPTFLYGLLWYSFLDMGRLSRKNKLAKKVFEAISWQALSSKRSG